MIHFEFPQISTSFMDDSKLSYHGSFQPYSYSTFTAPCEVRFWVNYAQTWTTVGLKNIQHGSSKTGWAWITHGNVQFKYLFDDIITSIIFWRKLSTIPKVKYIVRASMNWSIRVIHLSPISPEGPDTNLIEWKWKDNDTFSVFLFLCFILILFDKIFAHSLLKIMN